MLNLDRQISAIVEAAELGGRDHAFLDGAGLRSDDGGLINSFVQG